MIQVAESSRPAPAQPRPGEDHVTADDGATRQCLTFVCAGAEYGIDILRVQEIKGWSEATHVPKTPDYVLGVMNLRGVIVPVIDLRARFGLERRAFDASTVVVVVRVQTSMGDKTVGIVVDGVSDVHAFPVGSIRPPPQSGERLAGGSVCGLATVGERMISLLDVDMLVSSALEAI